MTILLYKPLCKKICTLGKIRMTLYPGLPGAGSVTPVVLINYGSAWMIWFPENTDCQSVVPDQQHQRYLETCKNANYGPIPDLPNQKLWGGALQPVFYQALHVVLTCPSCNWPKCWLECPICYSLVFQLQLIWSCYAWYHRYMTENTGNMFHHSTD